MGMVKIKDMRDNLPKEGELKEVKMRVLVDSVSRTQKEGGNRWVDLYVSDSTGKCNFKIWGEQLTENLEALVPTMEDKVIECIGLVELYRGSISLRVSGIKMAEEGSYEKADFYPAITTEGKENLINRYKSLLVRLKQLESPYYALVKQMFTLCRINAMAELPGGTANHAYRGGLLVHLVETAELAMSAAQGYMRNYSILPFGESVDEGLVIAGALLHDIGKLACLESRGTTSKATMRGLYVGPVVQSVLYINDVNNGLEEGQVASLSELLHCVSASDTSDENTEVRTLEAMIVRQANGMSETLHAFNRTWFEHDKKGRSSNTAYCKEFGGTVIRREGR